MSPKTCSECGVEVLMLVPVGGRGRKGGLCEQCARKYKDRPDHILKVLQDEEWRTLTEIQSLVEMQFGDKIPGGTLHGLLHKLVDQKQIYYADKHYFRKVKV